MHRRLRPIAAALVLALILAACGDDSSDTATDPRSEEERAADAALAANFVLTADDLPAGWVVDDDDDGGDGDDDAPSRIDDLAECLGVESNRLDVENPSAESPTFISADQHRVQSEVSATPSAEWVAERMELFQHELLASCLNEIFAEMLNDPSDDDPPPPGVTYGSPHAALLPFPEMGDGVQAVRITIPMTADDTEVDIYFDLVLVGHGRFGITMTFQGVFEPFSVDLAEELTRTVVDRIGTTT